MTLCEHQSTLTDPRTNNAECVHQRMLSDDVLRCQGMLTWFRGNPALIENINDPHKIYKWYTNTASSINECIYKRGNWKHSCGSEVEAMMGNLTKSFSSLHKSTITVIYSLSMFETIMCDICKPGSDLTKYHKLYYTWFKLLNRLMYKNQSPYLFRQCNVANYPLNQCHLRLIWRRDVYAMFCHQVRSVIVPVFTPHLPLCNFGDWVSSAARICNMGYLRFMDTASHIARCTKDRDELFPCYKGLYMNWLSWGLVTAGHVWQSGSWTYWPYLRTVYRRIKTCVPLVYDHLCQTCRHGPPVVQLIQDLRTVLMIDVPAMFSFGPLWHRNHLVYKRIMHVNHC